MAHTASRAEEAVSLSATVLWHEARAPLTIFGYGQVALYVARLPGDLLPCPYMVRYALDQALLWTLAPKMLEISWASRLTCDTRLRRNSSSDIYSCPTVIASYSGQCTRSSICNLPIRICGKLQITQLTFTISYLMPVATGQSNFQLYFNPKTFRL